MPTGYSTLIAVLVVAAAGLAAWLISRALDAASLQRADTGPQRLQEFHDALAALGSGQMGDGGLDGISDALKLLFAKEVRYYFRLRHRRSMFAMPSRLFAFVFGTVGLMVPLLAAAEPRLALPPGYGYVLLALAAASLAANRLFGGTLGHIRYTTAQYALEALLIGFSLDWQAWKRRSAAAAPGEEAKVEAEGFALLRALCTAAYAAMAEETRLWGATLSAAEEQFGQKLGK
ncbi:MAG: hypothetical protein QOJ91_2749 [Sphingomonadales bacterium]|jgi:hypothetical protein|nr:hypothetical protein [Sphingomonadales bacterium]